MKVILLENVAQVGQKYEVKDVPRGHALNFLIPRRLAEPATKKGLKRVEGMKMEQAASAEEQAAAFEAALEEFSKGPVTITAPANEQGHLYKGINAQTIAAQLHEKGIQIPEDTIKLAAPIKETGEHVVELSDGDKKGTLALHVAAQE